MEDKNTMIKSLADIEASLKTIQKPKIEKIEKTKEDKRKNNGGARPNSGRKPLAQDEKKRALKQIHEDFAMEEDEMEMTDRGTLKVRMVKMKRQRIILEALYKKAKNGDVSAIHEFNDRVLGKSKQPITGGDEDDAPLRLDVDIIGIANKIYGEDTNEE
jgi:hypothetical protein